MGLVATGFAEALQDYIATNSGLGLVVGSPGVAGNFTLSDILNVDSLEDVLGDQIICTLFEETGTITRTGRRHHQNRTFRFIYKGSYGQESINRCWALLQFLENARTFSTTSFTAWVARIDKTPTVIAVDQGGTHLADFVITFIVLNRTG